MSQSHSSILKDLINMKLFSNKITSLFLVFVILLAFWFRTVGINWDQNQHLHPDERFLTMVTERLSFPSSLSEYLDPSRSPMNPYNKETGFFVYGVLPLAIVKIVATIINQHTYDGIAITGRFMSALFDIGALIVVYKILMLMVEKFKSPRTVVLWGVFIYAVMVLPIQLSHFYTVDNFLVFFVITSVYFASLFYYRRSMKYIFTSAIFFGCALACKISAIYVLPLILALMIIPKTLSRGMIIRQLVKNCPLPIFYGLVSYLVLRFADPHLFQSASFFNLFPAEKLVSNMKELSNFASDNAGYFPPAVQWFNTPPITFALNNMVVFGIGIVACVGIVIGAVHQLWKGSAFSRMMLGWIILFFLYQSTRFSPSMRYFSIIYPLLAMFGAIGFWKIIERIESQFKIKTIFTMMILVVALLIYPIGFVHIYSVPHSRVSASYWINENLPRGATLTMEHWDDGLPLRVPSPIDKSFVVVQLPVFAEDNVDKWTQMQDGLRKADYVIMSSNRGYGSVLKQKQMYPIMSKWYEDLFAGRLSYVLEKEFTSFPTWCTPFTSKCVSFDDQWSEEAFTVYDHPKVSIFKKVK